MKIKREPSTYWSLHSHSRYSINDALPEVKDMVATVAKMRQPALGLTDHGCMPGSVQLYRECNRAGILPFPGSELYVVNDREDKKAKRHHMCVVAYTTEGYENLVNLSTTTFKNFYHKPLVDLRDLAELAEVGKLKGIAATSGCFFSLPSQAIARGDIGLAETYLRSFAGWFDKFYVELQNHKIDHGEGFHDHQLLDQLVASADRLGLPCVITQDAHYCHKEDKDDHETLKKLVSFGPDPDDAIFPGDGFHLASENWIRDHHSDNVLSRGFAGLSNLLEAHQLRIPELDAYHYNVPFTVADPDGDLRKKCEKELAERGLGPRYKQRLEEELDVIQHSRMGGYLLLVAEITDWCEEHDIFTQTRGSATGSLVCYLLGITQLDPIKWDLRYERFISRDRTKPPDIDLDVEHTKRLGLLWWLNERFAVNQIGTYLTYSLSGEDENAKGSLRVKYFARKRAAGEPVKNWVDAPYEDKQALYSLNGQNLISSYGVHPAGIVVSTVQRDLDRLVPLMYVASSKSFVTQYRDKDIEALGYVKFDILGLHTLSVLNKTMDNLGRTGQGMDWIPFRDKEAFKLIRSGYTSTVFQLDGNSAKRGIRDLQPTTIHDVIAAMALFRPATMKSGATESYIDRKHKREKLPKRHEIIAKVTDKTQGIMLFQEQVIDILKALGMNPDELTSFLSAIKASNKDIDNAGEIIAQARPQIKQLCLDANMSEKDFIQLWQDIEGFAEYGFNKAHSTAYGVTAYRCAYLAANHPLEYFAAVLNISAGTPKETEYIEAARYRSQRIKPPDINTSGASYEVDKRTQCIRKGFLSIKNLGDKAAQEIVESRPTNGYRSIKEFCEAVNHRKITGVKAFLTEGDITVGVLGHLYEANAFRSIE